MPWPSPTGTAGRPCGAEIDQRIMRDAPLVPLIWENYSFQWASRVHGWVYDPWAVAPDLTAVWLDPPSP